MVHGFTGSPASMRPMGTWFAEQGLSVIGVRLPGHGTTVDDLRHRPWTEWFSEVDGALTELRVGCSIAVVLGQSMAASLAVHLASTRPDAVDGSFAPSRDSTEATSRSRGRTSSRTTDCPCRAS